MSFKKTLLAVSLLNATTLGVSEAGSYSYTTGMLILDRVKVQTPTDNYYAQLSLQLSEQDGTFTGLGIVPLPDNFPSADATLTFDTSGNSYVLTVLNASGYYGVLTSASINGPYTTSNVISVQANLVGATGATGPKGDTGPVGPKGDTGTTGAKGDRGDLGLIGSIGPKGEKGDVGPVGPAGVNGLVGVAGQNGTNGKTVLNGTVDPTTEGVEGDFYINTHLNTLWGPKMVNGWPATSVSLVGPKGDTGATGLKGDTGLIGLKGDKGDPGLTGPKGGAGPSGTNGINGTNGLTVSVNNITQIGGNITLTKGNLGLGNVENTTDADKPISTATQTALDSKAPLVDPTFIGIPKADTAAQGTNTTQLATTAFVKAAIDLLGLTTFDYKIGSTGPGGGYIFFVDYHSWFAHFDTQFS